MNVETYSSEYLRNLPIKMRKTYIKNYSTEFEQSILDAARKGSTHFLIQEIQGVLCNSWLRQHVRSNQNISLYIQQQTQQANAQGRPWEATPPTKEELMEYLSEKFPGCKLTYEEKWVDISPDKKELRKGICVDWSN